MANGAIGVRTVEAAPSANMPGSAARARTVEEAPSVSIADREAIAKIVEAALDVSMANSAACARTVEAVSMGISGKSACFGWAICGAHPQSQCGHIGNLKYNRQYALCFANLFPSDPRIAAIRSKSKEVMWVNALLQSIALGNHECHWDKPFYMDLFEGCCATKRCIDLWAVVGNTIIAIEIDEI
eukprot:GHRR01012263.1.p1 GENE.GHRR01012263.1~~GHRR01012263.1.p1  ORF type:complete len:185 (+),score=10.74 GHRR01012263.1:879-1433(+)